ncbi:MAG: M14 family zinc carboxypeptidase [Bryobacteraceae bacterium]
MSVLISRRRALATGLAAPVTRFSIRPDYLAEPDIIPSFWISTFDDVGRFLSQNIRRGVVRVIGTSAGGRPIRAVFYGQPRAGKGTSTFSGSLGFRDVRAYIGPDYARKVYLDICGVHGGEFEGIVGSVNLLSVLETGQDLRGRRWPEITAAAGALDRIIVIPIMNPDGRVRVPLRMIRHRGRDETVQEYFNTGGKPDGTLIGWPQCKEHNPLDFSTTQFPGGYPNDAGVNIQHDDFFGSPQPETRALFGLTARERPDLILNMHTGAIYLQPLCSFLEPALTPVFEALYRRVMTALTQAGLEHTGDVAKESDPTRLRMSPFNLDSALNMHCGSLNFLIESPMHSTSTAERDGKPFLQTPDRLLDAHLIAQQEAMKFLADTGGRARWTPPSRPK